jgi:hypothetical protein
MQGFYINGQERLKTPASATMVALFFSCAYGEKERRTQRNPFRER